MEVPSPGQCFSPSSDGTSVPSGTASSPGRGSVVQDGGDDCDSWKTIEVNIFMVLFHPQLLYNEASRKKYFLHYPAQHFVLVLRCSKRRNMAVSAAEMELCTQALQADFSSNLYLFFFEFVHKIFK